MSQTITIRVPKNLSEWLEETAARTGISQGHLIRIQLEKAKTADSNRPFMRLARSVRGPKDLSRRKGFSKL